MKILVVLPRFPYPLEKGDKLRAYNQIRTLARHNEIYLFTLSFDEVTEQMLEAVRPFCREIRVARLNKLTGCKNAIRNFLASKSIQMGYWDSRSSRHQYKAFEREVEPDVIYSQMVRTMPLVARSLVPKVMDFQDALSLNMKRRMEIYRRGIRHFLFHFEFKMLRSTEYNSFDIFDDLTIISEPDCEAIPHKRNADLHIIPNGVDFDYFKPQEVEKKYDVVFCGNMQYRPNVLTAQYLVREVMPLVWKIVPGATLLLAGATPNRQVRALASDRVVVTGSVEDIRPCYAQSKVFAAPMQIGSGLQNKLLEAMALGIPCVTSPLANNALGAAPDREILVGTKAVEIADHIIDLIQSQPERDELARNAMNFVKNNYSWEHFGDALEKVLYNASKNKL